MEIIYSRAITDDELYQILELQRLNISTSISEEEKQTEGFVTVHHSFELLNAMNDACAHIIAKRDNKVIGYALAMATAFKNTIKVLEPMFHEIDNAYKSTNYIVMGQICVDKAYRKQGVFRGLYEFMRLELNNVFDDLITEVDSKNIRSLNAHKAIGFKLLKSYASNNQNWELIIWNWK